MAWLQNAGVRFMVTTTAHPPIVPLLLDVRAAARALSVSVRTVYTLFAAGKIRPLKIGRSTRVSVAELRRFADSLAAQPEVRP